MKLTKAIESFKRYKAANRSPATVKTYSTGLNRFMEWRGDINISDLTTHDLPGFVVSLNEDGLAPNSINNYTTSVNEFYKWLMRRELLDMGPGRYLMLQEELREMRKDTGQRVPKLPSEASVNGALLAASASDASDERLHLMHLRNRAMIGILESSGCRIAEAAALKRKELVTEDKGALVIGKGDKERWLYFSDAAWDDIHVYLKARDEAKLILRADSEPILGRHDKLAHGQRALLGLSTNALRDALKRICQSAGIVYFNPHKLRHRRITNVVEEKGIEMGRKIAGHASGSTTQIYTHLRQRDVRDAARSTMKG